MYDKIMVPLDGSELAECVMPHVEAITTGCKITSVVFVRVVAPIQLPARLPAQGEFGFQEKDHREMEQQRKKRLKLIWRRSCKRPPLKVRCSAMRF